MRLEDLLSMSFRALKERKLRTALTVLGVLVGVAAILALVSQTAGVQASVVSNLESLGPTTILLVPTGSTSLSQGDVAKILAVPNVNVVAPLVLQNGVIYQHGQPVQVSVIGIDATELQILLGSIRISEGIMYPPSSVPQALIGFNLAFPPGSDTKNVYVGQPLVVEVGAGTQYVRRLTIQTVGILSEYGSSLLLSPDDSIFMPLSAAMKIFNRKWYDMILVQAVDTDSIDVVSSSIRAIYGKSLTVMSVKQITQTASAITAQLGLLMGAIAATSLVVAALGIMNIMFVSVLERTREIGVLKSVGFKDHHVMLLFLFEAGIIGCLGGVFGIIMGVGVSYMLPSLITSGFSQGGTSEGAVSTPVHSPSVLMYSPLIRPDVVIAAFLIALLVSLIAGLYPAWRAAKMDPIKALRHE